MPKTIRVLLADDHKLVRQGLSVLVNAQPDMTVVGEAADGNEAVAVAANQQADVVVMDLMMPNLNGLEATAQLRRAGSDTQVVILSMHASVAHAIQALRNGAMAYVLKDSDSQEIFNAVRAAAAKRHYVDPKLAEPVFDALLRVEPAADDPYRSLTAREHEILQLVAEGHTNAVIAEKLGVSLRTVETHRSNLMHKLDLHSQADLIRYALQRGPSEPLG